MQNTLEHPETNPPVNDGLSFFESLPLRPIHFDTVRPDLAGRPPSGPRHAAPESGPADTLGFAPAVKKAIAKKGCSLRELDAMLMQYGQLRSGPATISGWQNGINAPSANESGLNRVLALERCLDVPAGDLAMLIPGGVLPSVSRPLSQLAGQAPAITAPLGERHKHMQGVVNRLSGPQLTIPVETRKTYTVGHLFRPVQTLITPVVRAAHDHVDRYWFLHAPGSSLHPTVTAVTGCTVGRVLTQGDEATSRDPGGTAWLVAVELLFDKLLRRGDYYTFTFSIGYASDTVVAGTPETSFRHVQCQPCERLDLSLEFQGHSPVSVDECDWDSSREFTLTHSRPAAANGIGRYHRPIKDPALAGFGWSWDWRDGARNGEDH